MAPSSSVSECNALHDFESLPKTLFPSCNFSGGDGNSRREFDSDVKMSCHTVRVLLLLLNRRDSQVIPGSSKSGLPCYWKGHFVTDAFEACFKGIWVSDFPYVLRMETNRSATNRHLELPGHSGQSSTPVYRGAVWTSAVSWSRGDQNSNPCLGSKLGWQW